MTLTVATSNGQPIADRESRNERKSVHEIMKLVSSEGVMKNAKTRSEGEGKMTTSGNGSVDRNTMIGTSDDRMKKEIEIAGIRRIGTAGIRRIEISVVRSLNHSANYNCLFYQEERDRRDQEDRDRRDQEDRDQRRQVIKPQCQL